MKKRASKNTPRVFRPLVASSLAIALGVSVATATCTPNGNPLICYGTTAANNAFTSSGDTTLSWINGTTQAYSPKVGNGSQTFIDNLVFKFTNEDPSKAPTAEATKGIYQEEEIKKEYQKYIISMGAGANRDVSNNDLDAPIAGSTNIISSLKFDAGQKAIKLGELGDGTITVDFGDFTSNGLRSMEMNFDGSASASQLGTVSPSDSALSGSYSLVGNIAILSGDEATYKINFDHSMRGDITIYTNSFRNWSKYISGTKGKIAFKGNANLEGSIRSEVSDGAGYYDANTTKGGVNIVFGTSGTSTNTITGDISFVNGDNTITFEGAGTVKGTIGNYGSGYVEGGQADADGTYHEWGIYGQSKVTFGGDATIGNIESIVSGTNYFYSSNFTITGTQISNNAAQNIFKTKKDGSGDLTFNAENVTLKVFGGGRGLNSIETQGALTLKLAGMQADGNRNGHNHNVVRGGSGSSVTIGSKGIFSHWGSALDDQNIIELQGNSTLKINATSIDNGFEGDKATAAISTRAGQNVINVHTLTIQQDDNSAVDGRGVYTEDKGINTLTVNALTINTTQEGVVANDYGSNIFNITGNATISTLVIAKSNGTNILNFGGETSIGAVAAVGGENDLVFSNGANNNTIDSGVTQDGNIGDGYSLLTYKGGKNYITLKKNSTSLTMKGVYHRWSGGRTQFSVQGDNSTLTIGNTYVDGGAGEGLNIDFSGANGILRIGTVESGTFTAGTLKNGANIDNAITNISFAQSGTIKGEIVTERSGSTTNILFKQGGTIEDHITTKSGATANIVFEGSGTNTITGHLVSDGGINNVTMSGSSNTITLIRSQYNSQNIVTVKSGGLNVTQYIKAERYQGSSQNLITIENGDLTVGDEIRINNSPSSNKNIIHVLNGNLNGKVVRTNSGLNEIVVSKKITLEGDGGKSIDVNGGITNLTAESMTLKGNNDVIRASGGEINLTANELEVIRTTDGSAMWSSGSAQTNITITDGGHFYAYKNGGNTITNLAIDNNSILNLTFEGDATLKANFTVAHNSEQNKNIMNFGNENSTGVSTVTLQGSLTNSNSVGIANIFNFNADSFTFSFKDGTGSNYQDLAFGNARENAINFNADAGVLDLGTNNISITGSLDINLKTEQTSNTIKATKIATSGSGTTNVNFITDGATLNLFKDSAGGGTFETTAGTSTINFAEGITGTFNGVINSTGGTATIKIGDGANGVFLKEIKGSTTNVEFLKVSTPEQPESRDALGGTLTLQGGITSGTPNSFGTITADGTYGMVVSGSEQVSNTIATLDVKNNGQVAFYNGTSTIKGFGSGDGTLELTTKTDEVNTLVKLQLTGNGSSNPVNTKILFTGGTEDQRYRSTLEVVGDSNTITSLESQATNAVVKLDGSSANSAVTITDKITITKGHSLLFSLTSGTNETAIATAQGGITVEDGGTLGVAIGAGSGEKKLLVGSNGNVEFKDGSTLQVDFLSGAAGTATLGSNSGNQIEIKENRKSIINFHGNVGSGVQLAGGLKISGGDNTVNFLGNATLSSVTFSSGTNTINVYDGKTGTIKLDDGGAGSQLGSMTNTINLKSGSTLDVQQTSGTSGSGTLTADNADKPSTLNFIGDNATFKGGFKAQDTGKALINVGLGTQKPDSVLEVVSGTITGNVTDANLAFNAGKSTLTLQGETNTFKTLTSNAKDGILKLDATNKAISAQINGDILIDTGTSLTFDLTSGSTNSAAATITGNITVNNGGTLGIAIGGDGTGTRSVTMSGGGTPTLNPGSTLRVDFLKDANGTASLGSGDSGFTIKAGRNSEINFYGGTGTPSLKGGITLDGGTNTANFYGSATLRGIELKSGENHINVKAGDTAGITATVDTSSISNNNDLTNYINLENKATIDLQNNNSGSGSGSITASVTVSGTQTKVKGSLTDSSITFDKAIADLTLQGTNTITALKGYNAPASYIRQGRVVTPTVENTLILDGSNNSSAEIENSVTSDTVGLKFASGTAQKTFTFSASGNTISNVLFGTTSTNNTLAFTKGASTIAQAMDVGTDNGLTIALGSDQINTTSASPISLNLVGEFKNTDTGTATLSIKGKDNVSAVVSGADIDIKNLDLVASQSASLAIKNASATFGTLTATQDSTLTLDGSENAVNVVVTKLNSNNLTANFAGQGEDRETVLKINDSNASDQTITLADVSVADGSTHNTLDLSALTKATVSSEVKIEGSAESAKGLTIKLQDTALNLAGGMTTSDATTTVRVENTTGAGATISGGTIQITNLDMVGTGDLKTTLAATSTEIATLTAQGETSNTLIVDGTSTKASGTIGSIVGESLQVELNGTTGATLAINGVGGTIKSLSTTNGTANTLSLQSGKLVVTDVVNKTSVASSKGLNLEFAGNSELSVVGGIDTTNGGNVNISVKGKSTPNAREATEGDVETPAEVPTEGIISGGEIKINTLSFADNAALQVRNANATFTEVKGTGVLSLDGANTKNGVKATVTNEITNSSNAITANFNGRTDKGNELVLEDDSTLKTITFGDNSVNNKISVAGTKTLTLSEQVVVTKGSGITFALIKDSTIDFKKGMVGEGTSTLRVEATSTDNNNSTLKGGTFTSNAREASSENSESVTTGTEITNLDLVAYVDPAGSNNKAAKLTIQDSDVTIGKVTAQEGETTLVLDASSNAVLTTINAISGKTLTLELTSNGSNEARLALRGRSNVVKSLNVTGTKNILDLDNSSIVISDQVIIANGETLGVDLAAGRYVATTSQTEIESGGTMTFNFNSGLSEIGGAGINVKDSGTLNLNVGVENTSGARALIGVLSKEASGTVNLTFNGDADTFFFDPTSATASKLEITTLKSNGNGNTVDIASSRFGTSFDVNYTRKDFRVLKVGDNTADADTTRNTLNFKVFVDKTQSGGLTIGGETLISGQATDYGYAYSDRIILDKGTQTTDTQAVTHNLLIIPKIDQLGQITYKSGGTETEGNVAVATVKKDSGITLATEKVISGFEVIQAELVQVETDVNGKVNGGGQKDYTTYFLGEVKSVGASEQMQDVASTALSINYDLYMANFNSLNKRMGELRDDPYNQGVWARVFGGSQESSFGVGSKSEYVTFQAGYDYDFTFSNAKNYLGVAFSYATSTSKSFDAFQNIANANASASNIVGIENIKSGAYEIAVYNSYISDSGWYNDTIAKFSYIDSTFNLTGSANDSQTTNMAFTIGDEVGYRYKFAENEKGSWYVDPQVEIAFGYLNQSDFNSKMYSAASRSGYSTLNAYQDAVITLRTRVGASLGKKFNTQNGFASLYVGAFYEYDYVEGGSSDVGVGSGATNTLTPLSSSGRAVLNIGSNIALTENARLYVDVEKSLGDKFTTHMQFNFGARYSFGEKSVTLAPKEEKNEVAPLKIEDKK